jgi:SprT protein
MSSLQDNSFRQRLIPYLGEEAAVFIDNKTINLRFHLKITKVRATKFGDYCPPRENKKQRITINGNLDKYSFLITLLHELAHLLVYEKNSNLIKPHGKEWKNVFSQLLSEAINHLLFPPLISQTVNKYYIQKQCFTHTSRIHILNSIYKTLDKTIPIRLEAIPVNSTVVLENGMTVTKIEQKRTRCICRNYSDKKLYSIHKSVEVVKFIQ